VAAFEAAKGLPARSVRDVLRGRSVRRAALALADFLGEPVGKVFPGRFISDDCKSPNGDLHSLNRQAV